MKKIILTSAIIFGAAVATFAQTSVPVTEIQKRTDFTTLNINLYPIQTLEVNAAQKNVNLDYKTKNDYANGVSSDQKNHLSIYSTGGFNVKVRSVSDKLAGVKDNIDAIDVKVTPKDGTNNPLTGGTLTAKQLTTNPEIIITNSAGGVDKNFDINYEAKGNDKYVNKYYNSESPTTYSTTVIYSIEAI